MQQNKKFLRVLCSLLAAALAAWCTVLLCRWVGYDLQERLGNTPSYEIINDDYSQIIDIPAEGLTQAMPLKAVQHSRAAVQIWHDHGGSLQRGGGADPFCSG